MDLITYIYALAWLGVVHWHSFLVCKLFVKYWHGNTAYRKNYRSGY